MKNHEPQPIAPFCYGDIELSETVLINGIPHMTRRAIGEFLEYADPQKAIDNILSRNQHIFEFQYPSVLRGTDGKNYDVFVYDPVGFMLICMESGQPKAVRMKLAIAQFVHRYLFYPQNISFKERLDLKKYRRTLLNDLEKCCDKFTQQGLLAELADVDSCLGCTPIDISLLGKDPRQIDLEDLSSISESPNA